MSAAVITTNEIMDFLREHMVTRKEFGELKADVEILKSDVAILKSEVVTLKSEVGVIKHDIKEINSRLDHIDREISEIKMRLNSLEKFSFEDSNAYAGDILLLKNKVASLEQQLARLQAQVAQ